MKVQVLNSLARLQIHGLEKAGPAFEYVLAMAKCDALYSVRDRARLYGGLVSSEESEEAGKDVLGRKIILASENVKPISSPMEDQRRNSFSIGSLSHLVNHCAPGYQALSGFRDTPTSSSIRDPRHTISASRSQGGRHNGDSYPGSHAAGGQAHHHNHTTVGTAAVSGSSPLDNFYSDQDSDGYSGSYSYSYSESEEEEAEGEEGR